MKQIQSQIGEQWTRDFSQLTDSSCLLYRRVSEEGLLTPARPCLNSSVRLGWQSQAFHLVLHPGVQAPQDAAERAGCSC